MHTPSEQVRAGDELLMTPAGHRSKTVFHYEDTYVVTFPLHIRVSDFKLKWQIPPLAALSQLRTLMAESEGRKVRPLGWLC